ncbi:hypothetical protein MTYP_01507 [Methylophilaceae bacterium]|nr:hypothetical protein MTYP_01507 [Methylophilaceae bacterium]
MRLVTSCPECTAAFYVSPEQLAAHRGDVRCGRCEHVFNALENLSEVADEPVQPPVTAEAEDDAVMMASSGITFFIQDEPSIPDHASEPSIDTLPEELAEQETEPQFVYETVVGDVLPEETPAEPEAETPVAKTSAVAGPLPAEATEPTFNLTDYSVPPAFAIDSPIMVEDVARKNSGTDGAGKRRLFKFLLIFLVIVLLILATGQAIYYLRSDIAARMPQMRPYLEQGCKWIGCTVELPKIADLLVIDDSELREDIDRQGLIHLYSSLVNNADFYQAYPLLELTLTDDNDKPLLRRTFTPADYLASKSEARQGLAPHQTVDIKLSLTTSGQPVAGYRVFVTY